MIGAQVLIGDLREPFLGAALRSVAWCDYYTVVAMVPPEGQESEAYKQNWETVRRVVPEDRLRQSAVTGLDFARARNEALGMVPDGDFVMIVDSDDCHYPEWKDICGYYLANGADSITAAFHHFVVYRDAVQAVYPREIVFRKTPETQFVGRVHEKLVTTRRNPVVADYRYCHFGYLRGQPNVFERWRRYSEIEGEPNHYAGQSPEHIIDDRVSVATRFTLEYPPAVCDLIEEYPVCPVALQGESEPEPPKVVLIMLGHDDPPEKLAAAIRTLAETNGHFELWALWSQGEPEVLANWEKVENGKGAIDLKGWELPERVSLAEALNTGFRWALDQGFEYIGWVHPDMRFDDPDWLNGLLHELRCWPKVGKVCAANTRDPIPERMIDGHEQCFLIRAELLREIGLFDEGYVGIGGREDWDWNRRCIDAGYRVVITPRSKVFHEGMATRSRRDTTAEQVKNAERYHAKWGTDEPPV